jgi:hypothetical protein
MCGDIHEIVLENHFYFFKVDLFQSPQRRNELKKVQVVDQALDKIIRFIPLERTSKSGIVRFRTIIEDATHCLVTILLIELLVEAENHSALRRFKLRQYVNSANPPPKIVEIGTRISSISFQLVPT